MNEIKKNDEKLFSSIIRFNARILGFALGILLGGFIFIMTNWLVIKGGEPIGPHLGLLGQFFIGYRVSFLGSFIGFAYGFALGTLAGSFIAWIYNKIVDFKGKKPF